MAYTATAAAAGNSAATNGEMRVDRLVSAYSAATDASAIAAGTRVPASARKATGPRHATVTPTAAPTSSAGRYPKAANAFLVNPLTMPRRPAAQCTRIIPGA